MCVHVHVCMDLLLCEHTCHRITGDRVNSPRDTGPTDSIEDMVPGSKHLYSLSPFAGPNVTLTVTPTSIGVISELPECGSWFPHTIPFQSYGRLLETSLGLIFASLGKLSHNPDLMTWCL